MENEKLTSILRRIQCELKAPKSQFNSFGQYNYRSCEDILESVKPILGRYGCYITISDELVAVGERYYVKATATIGNDTDKISVTAFAREEETKKGMDGSQITGASSSYARKYALNGLFAIDDTKDSDATNKGESKVSNYTSDQVDILIGYGYTLDQVATRLKKSVKELTKEDLDGVISKIKAVKGANNG